MILPYTFWHYFHQGPTSLLSAILFQLWCLIKLLRQWSVMTATQLRHLQSKVVVAFKIILSLGFTLRCHQDVKFEIVTPKVLLWNSVGPGRGSAFKMPRSRVHRKFTLDPNNWFSFHLHSVAVCYNMIDCILSFGSCLEIHLIIIII